MLSGALYDTSKARVPLKNNDPNNRTGHMQHVYQVLFIQRNCDETQSHCLLLQNNGMRGAIEKLTRSISAWVDQIQIPLYKERVPISDPRRMLLYMTGMIMTTFFPFQHNESIFLQSDLYHG